jgi:benzoyl-CoA reductase subunit BamC
MCEDVPPQKEPMCVQACHLGTLTYEEMEVEVDPEEEVKSGEMETGLQLLVDKYGLPKLLDTIARMSQKG